MRCSMPYTMKATGCGHPAEEIILHNAACTWTGNLKYACHQISDQIVSVAQFHDVARSDVGWKGSTFA